MNDKPVPTNQDQAPVDAAQLTDAAVEAAAGGGSLKSLFVDVQRGLWANNPDLLREVMDRHNAKPSAPGGSGTKDA